MTCVLAYISAYIRACKKASSSSRASTLPFFNFLNNGLPFENCLAVGLEQLIKLNFEVLFTDSFVRQTASIIRENEGKRGCQGRHGTHRSCDRVKRPPEPLHHLNHNNLVLCHRTFLHKDPNPRLGTASFGPNQPRKIEFSRSKIWC